MMRSMRGLSIPLGVVTAASYARAMTDAALDRTCGTSTSDRDAATGLRRIDHLAQLAAVVRACPGLHVRYSEGPDADTRRSSIDTESGLELPGLSVNPLDAERWWTRPLEDWLARQLCQYRHLAEKDPQRIAWVLRGEHCGRGPDCEPLLREVEPIAVIGAHVLLEARERYERNFDAGRGPADDEEDRG